MPLAAPVTIATLSVKRAIAFVYGVARDDHARAQDIAFDKRKTLAWVARVTAGLRLLKASRALQAKLRVPVSSPNTNRFRRGSS